MTYTRTVVLLVTRLKQWDSCFAMSDIIAPVMQVQQNFCWIEVDNFFFAALGWVGWPAETTIARSARPANPLSRVKLCRVTYQVGEPAYSWERFRLICTKFAPNYQLPAFGGGLASLKVQTESHTLDPGWWRCKIACTWIFLSHLGGLPQLPEYPHLNVKREHQALAVLYRIIVREHMSLKKDPWDFCDDFKKPV